MSLLFIFCRKMTAFIKLKANTGFCIKKSKLVQQETDAIDSSYQKKFKQATMSQQITRSTVANKTRLRVLGARQKSLDNIFDKAAKRLGKTAQDNDRYECVLKGCISVGFYALNELKPKSRARK
ncbi:ATPase, V1/A1 complex, subunit E, partial [Cladorrhinum sp. PSN259]